jgi:TetR/AcrR family transcriptional regulator, tetracycline repressor protein
MVATSEHTPQRLSREAIVDAYLRVVEADGPDAATLRRLGAELGADPTSVYRHVRDKDEILAAAADRVLSEAAEGFEPTGSWRTDLRDVIMRARGAYLAHPQALMALQSSPSSLPDGYRLAELAVGLLRDTGLDDDEVAVAFETLEGFTIGAASLDAYATRESEEAWRRVFAALPPREYPNLTALALRLYQDAEQAFAYGLDLLLDALEARVKEAAG